MMSKDAKSTQDVEDVRPEDISERELDKMVEDSFPASDPPSTTPLTALGDAPMDATGRSDIAAKSTGPSVIICYVGEDEAKYAPVVQAAMDSAREGATLIFYDAEAGSRFGSPTTTFWSGDRDRDVDNQVERENVLQPADLEAAGREPIARLVNRAREAGIDAYGWLPTGKGADELNDYATQHGADLIILPSDLEHVGQIEKLVKGTAAAKDIADKSSIPVVTVDTADGSGNVPADEVTLV
jgi:nucleotide-binding universal stress UspA family protein